MKKQIVFGGKIMDGYFIEYKNEQVRILSTKQTNIKELSIPKSGSSSYPGLVFTVSSKKIRADTHRVIAENLVPFPRPKCLTKEVWNKIPQSGKDHIMQLYFVNHIDHDKYNCHPSNLEWVTSKGNSHAYHKHKKGLK